METSEISAKWAQQVFEWEKVLKGPNMMAHEKKVARRELEFYRRAIDELAELVIGAKK